VGVGELLDVAAQDRHAALGPRIEEHPEPLLELHAVGGIVSLVAPQDELTQAVLHHPHRQTARQILEALGDIRLGEAEAPQQFGVMQTQQRGVAEDRHG
jgi:hypothetical protein